jgi:hypothetical protein
MRPNLRAEVTYKSLVMKITNGIKLKTAIDGEGFDDHSGVSVSLTPDGTKVAIGAIHNGGNGENAGHVRVYNLSQNTSNKTLLDLNSIQMYPNPTTGIINLSSADNQTRTIRVLDISGKVMQEVKVSSFFLSINTNGEVVTTKVVKE